MDENSKSEKLSIFENCSSMDYILTGFTKNDLLAICICVGVSIVAAIILISRFNNTPAAILFVFIFSAFAVLFFKRDSGMENCIDKIRIFYQYQSGQKKYEYEYVNIYEAPEKEKIEDD